MPQHNPGSTSKMHDNQEFSPAEIERLWGLLDGRARDGIQDEDFTPLTKDMINAPIPDPLMLSMVTLFDGTGDPFDHLGVYSSWSGAYGYSDTIKC